MAVTYTLSQLRVEVAENVGYDDGSGTVLSTKDLTSTMIDKYLNRRYYQAIAKMAARYPADYERVSETTFYKTTGTVNTVSSTTLTSSDITFNNNMVNDTIYNSTVSDTAVIESYTSGTEVELRTAPTGWSAADTIYVLGHEFTLGSAADDARYPIEVRVKYASTDTEWTECERRARSAVYKEGSEVFTEVKPIWYRTNIKVGTDYVYAVGVLPENNTASSDIKGLQITYIEMPPKMSSNTDVPELPLGSQHFLIYGATVDALRKLRRYDEIPSYKEDWLQGTAELIGDYARGYVSPRKGKRTQREYDMRRRRI